MLSALGEILGNAIGVAISPVPIIALILMLFSASAARNSIAFMLGWVTALTGVGMVVLAIGLDSSSGGESDTSGWIKIVLGLLLLALAVKQWRTRPVGDDEPAMPGWMSAIDGFSAVKAFGVALLLAGPNPKNLALTVAAASTVSGAGLSSGEEVTTMLLFVVIASITVIVPVVVYLVMGARATPALDAAKGWLLENNNTVMSVLFLVLGAKVLGDGISIVA